MTTDARAELEEFIQSKEFSCLGARSALKKGTIRHGHYPALGEPESARANYRELLGYARDIRPTLSDKSFRTFVASFETPGEVLEELEFERLLWRHLQLMHDIDSRSYGLDDGATSDPNEPHFGFHVAGHAFFLVGMHPGSSRASRRFVRPAIAFNSLMQFMLLGEKFFSMQDAIRKRETNNNGSVNPSFTTYEYEMPSRHYAGRMTEPDWKCPFTSRHEAAPAKYGLDTLKARES
ncbi:guanitoxin biosynthesis heme-dependent pre-guanitoxin N-hydroxylase GntA [Sciscionella marina]|uniref:guanitoxin biosynthesis heme-dependent pre-guanitoxin N-hydroxylase GntA n=1 Tax=Sciscionella marina TaxID=508770 RepID=UPI00036E53A8|nr:guanitoxin biosynthesis heme-dependent pre-guanitoxin N-hydroxylase GntA [Sciscionella marina]